MKYGLSGNKLIARVALIKQTIESRALLSSENWRVHLSNKIPNSIPQIAPVVSQSKLNSVPNCNAVKAILTKTVKQSRLFKIFHWGAFARIPRDSNSPVPSQHTAVMMDS
jgi:hypothetical protein